MNRGKKGPRISEAKCEGERDVPKTCNHVYNLWRDENVDLQGKLDKIVAGKGILIFFSF
jgi:hypothetical protein